MGKPQPYAISLFCEDAPFLGGTWWALVGFRPTSRGFSVWVDRGGGLIDTTSRKCVAKRTRVLTWQRACEELLALDEGSVFGDFRREVEVSGVDGPQAEVLALCWMKGDEIPSQDGAFLAKLSAEDLDWLAAALGASLLDDASLDLVGRYTQLETRSPPLVWSAKFQSGVHPSFRALVDRVEQDAEERYEQQQNVRKAALAPYARSLREIIDTKSNQLGQPASFAAGMAQTARLRTFQERLEAFVLEHGRLPDADEVGAHWRG